MLATASAQVCVPLGHSSLYFTVVLVYFLFIITSAKEVMILLCFFLFLAGQTHREIVETETEQNIGAKKWLKMFPHQEWMLAGVMKLTVTFTHHGFICSLASLRRFERCSRLISVGRMHRRCIF